MSQEVSGNTNSLRKNSLGFAAIAFMVISAAAPLTGIAGAVPIAMLIGNGAGIPVTFLFMTIVMLIFSVGYVAMARHVTNAGAFYAYAARGLGGRMGGAVSITALVAYNAMQFGLIGLFGGIASGVFGELGIVLPWWAWSLIAIVLVGVLGYRQVDLSAKVLAVLVVCEYIIVFVVDGAILAKGGAEGLSLNLADVHTVFSGSPAVAILFCLGAFIGFEATTIYAEEARDPARTIPLATYVSVLVIGLFFVFTTWLMVMAVGAEKLVPTIEGLKDPTEFFFELASKYVGGPVPTLAGILLVTSIFAALTAFHSYIARYSYVAGREGLLPAVFGQTHNTHQSPHIGSLAQTAMSLMMLGVSASLDLDPVLNLFTWTSQVGILGVLGMMAVTSLSVIVFFRKTPNSEPAFTTVFLPAISGLVMLALFVYVFLHFGDLSSTSGALGVVLPSLIPIAAIGGYFIASRLARNHPSTFARMGQNQKGRVKENDPS